MMEHEIHYSDKTRNTVDVYSSKSSTTVICLPAMGVRASFYKSFATELNIKGYNVLTVDWRGQGRSSIRASRKVNFGYRELISDIKRVVEHSNSLFPDSKIVLIGHSLGGQIGSLFTSRFPDKIEGLILITSCSVYYKGWDKKTSFKLFIAGKLFYPISKLFGYFPGNIIGFGGKEAEYIMKDWCNNTITGNYQLVNSSFDYDISLKGLTKNVLSISIENDSLASKNAVENLYKKFDPKSNVQHLHITEKQSKLKPLNHFSWAKKPEYFTELVDKWINKNIK